MDRNVPFAATRARHTNRLRHGAAVLLAAVLLHCGPAMQPSSVSPTALPPAPLPTASSSSGLGWTPTPDASFRQSAPAPSAESAWEAPIPEEIALSNGMKVLFVHRPALPIVVVQVVTRRGADQQSLPGLGSFVGEILEQGTTTRSAVQISDELEAIGAEHGSWVDWDSGSVWVKVIEQHLDKALDVLADVLQHPAFDKKEVERVRSQRLASIQQQVDMPEVVLRNTIARATFPNQIYGESLLGTTDTVARITPGMLRAFYEGQFAPDRTIAVVVGSVTKEVVIPKLERALGQWKRKAQPVVALRPPPETKPEIVIVDRPGAPQSNIALAGVGVERTTRDFEAILVANTILGGMFSSRLNLNLRERHAYTYGARSVFEMRHGPGPFFAGAAVDTPNTVAAIAEILAEFERFTTAPVTDEEIASAKGMLVKSLPGRFEANATTASSIAWLGVYGLPLDEFRTRATRINRITADDVLRIAKKYLDKSKMRIVVVGDRKVIEADLAKVGHGPVRVASATRSAKP